MEELKSIFTKDMLKKIKDLARLGTSNKKIAEIIGISEHTLYDWMKKYPEIDNAINCANELMDAKVVNALFRKTQGLTLVEKTFDGEGNLISKTTKKVAPDTNAMKYWLKVRRKNQENNWNETENVNIKITPESWANSLDNETLEALSKLDEETVDKIFRSIGGKTNE
jgi:hypothetical protein